MAQINTTFNKLIKGAGLSFLGQVISTGLKYLTQVLLAWLMGAEVFGLYTLGIIIYQLGELFPRMGLETGAIRYVSIHHDQHDQRRLKGVLLQALGFPLISGLVFGAALFLVAEPVAQIVFGQPELVPALQAFAVALPFGASMTAGVFATTGFQTATYKVFIWEVLLPLLNLVLAIALFYMGWGLRGAAMAWTLALIVSLLATLSVLQRLCPVLFKQRPRPIFESKKLLAVSIPLSLGSFLWLIMLWTDILMLGYFRPPAEVGIYRAASQTALLMTLFTRSLVTIFTPMIANLYSSGKLEELDKLFCVASRWSFSLTLPLFLSVAVIGEDILKVFGQEFGIGWLPLIILAAGQLARAGPGGFSMHILSMSGHQNLKLMGDIVLAITNIGLNMFMIPRWGLMGAAVATGISILGVNLLRVLQVYSVLKIHGFQWGYLKVITAGGISLLCGIGINAGLAGWPTLTRVSCTLGIIVTLYTALVLTFGLESSDRTMLNQLQQKLGFSK
ncbi:oligosaccharide flippase family protein [Adonisia turfae]|uniref:Flippase n=1 Tax=Adonisia turfae CCMR0081 TaxID=2292702 RepID=A0A6M0RIA7_9CYAN|nr:oligosaccharide flippase family protein [Adonisia turfae]NEZ55987.1 flippase [Adonisia turfae CCMR0081]